jgi:D-glycero-alpha-D-manno-heptose-7-phosphate kinase
LGGKQDQYAAAFGGFNLFEFGESGVQVHPIDVSEERAQELRGLMTLCYSGQARLSSNLHANVWGGFRAGKSDVVDSLFSLRKSAYEAKEILEAGNWDAFGPLLQKQHECARRLDSSVSNELTEGLFDLVRPHVSGGKCCGAGGGGCMIFLSPSRAEQQKAAAKLRAQGIRVIDFDWARQGLEVSRSEQ